MTEPMCGESKSEPSFTKLADISRRAEAKARQFSRRQQEWNTRMRVVALAEMLQRSGHSLSRAARRIGLRPRTLCHWKLSGINRLNPAPRGRPCREAERDTRIKVLETIDQQGPHVGLPTIRDLLPDVSRCQLVDLQRRYRAWYRQTHWETQAKLTWHQPGSVWAIDHTKPPRLIDGVHEAILAVRDLSSGFQLAWVPVPDQTSEQTINVLAALFRLYGSPLVLKSDNGSAFTSATFAELLTEWNCQQLLSPARTPRYNGACEAGIGAMQKRTAHFASHAGRPGSWVTDDCNRALYQANHIHRSESDPYRSKAERWELRQPITEEQRVQLRDAIANHEQLITDIATQGDRVLTQAALTRRAISQALVSLGLLTVSWRRIHPPIKFHRLANIS